MDESSLTMDLYIFNETNRAAVYGIGTYIRELSAALKESAINVCVVHLMSDRPDVEMVQTNHIRHLFIPSPIQPNTSLDSLKKRELYYRSVVYLLRLQITDTNALVFHMNHSKNHKLAEELKKVFNCVIITSIHCLEWSFLLFGNVTHFRKIVASANDELKKNIDEMYRREKDYFDIVDNIICLSENTRQIIQNDYLIKPKKIKVIYNGLSDNNSKQNRQFLQTKYNIPNLPVFLFAGRLADIKGLVYALRAFKYVLKTQSKCHFIIAGDGSFDIYMKECEDIWMNVTWTGKIEKDKLYDLYSIADIGVMPSFHEQCSYVAIEMMMHGLPIIGSTTTGLKEMIIDGETGLHIPVIEYDDRVDIDASLLADKMLYLLQNPEKRKTLGVNARKRYETVYSSEVFSRNMTNFYASLLEKERL